MVDNLGHVIVSIREVNQRTLCLCSPVQVWSFELDRVALDERVDKILTPQLGDSIPLPSQELANQMTRIKDKKKMELLSLESHALTNQFRREVDYAARRIHVLIAKSGRQGIDVDIIRQKFSF